MIEFKVVSILTKQLVSNGEIVKVPLIKGNEVFEAKYSADGIFVDNLGNQPFLPWNVFTETISLLKKQGGRAKRGNAINFKLGTDGLPLDSVEGHIAHKVYGKKKGETVFRRITPIACILIWSGLCKHESGELVLNEEF